MAGLLVASSLLASGVVRSDTRVLLDRGRVSIHSQAAPLADILSRFAQATGTKVVYEAARPRQLVSVVIEAGSAAEAIAQLLEGQGLNYALRLDPTGTSVEMLIITGSASPTATAEATRTPRASPPSFRAPEEVEEEVPGGAEEPFAPDAPEGLDHPPPAPGAPPEDATNPAVGAPWPVAPGVAPGPDPSNPQPPSGPPAPEPAPPQVPAPVSYPGRAPVRQPVPSPPVYPGPASYPG